MKQKENINRRNAIKTMALGSSAMVIPKLNPMTTNFSNTPLKGNIRQSVCQWCYGNVPLEKLAQEAKKMGLIGIDLIGAEGWDVLKKYAPFRRRILSQPRNRYTIKPQTKT